MLKVRLRKPGKSIKGRRHQKIVVTESSWARESKFIDEIGYYDPARELLKIDTEKYQKWLKQGAKPSETVASLFKNYGKRKREESEFRPIQSQKGKKKESGSVSEEQREASSQKPQDLESEESTQSKQAAEPGEKAKESESKNTTQKEADKPKDSSQDKDKEKEK